MGSRLAKNLLNRSGFQSVRQMENREDYNLETKGKSPESEIPYAAATQER